jgi:hypothetical protein
MKRTPYAPRIIEFFVKAGMIAALAAVLLAPMTIRATGSELARHREHAWPMLKHASWNSLPLPPIPHLETMPWLTVERSGRWTKIDTLLAPKFEIPGPAAGGECASSWIGGLPTTWSGASHQG